MSETPETTEAPPDAHDVVETPAPAPAAPKPEESFRLVEKPEDDATPYLAPDLPIFFVPRRELLEIKKLLLGRPVASLAPLTLHGPSGSGKTALAVALAHDADILETFPDGVLWYSLGDDGDIQHAQSVWGDALSYALTNLPDTASRAAALRTVLRDSRVLLIIDDVTDVEQIKALNVGGPNCARLITTDLGDEITYAFKTRRYEINEMTEAEALNLLTSWAGMLPDIYLPTVKEIVKRLTFLPLTLSLIGAQARQGITWLRLLEVLRDDQGPISNFDENEPEVRANALGLVINLVLSRFGGKQLQRSTLLGAFAAGSGSPFSVDAAAACWEMERDEAASTLKALVEASLVQQLPEGLFALHRALRDHLRNAARPGMVEGAAERVREYYTSLVEQTSVTTDIDAQLGQIMTVYRYTRKNDPESAGLFADALMSYFERRGLWANLITLARQVIAETRESGDVMREQTYVADLGYAQSVVGDLEGAQASFERALAISRDLSDGAGEATALNNIGAIFERKGDLNSALQYYEQSLDIRRVLGVREDIAEALNNVAGVYYWRSRWDDALKTFQRALDMYNVLNDRLGQAQTWLNIGAVYERMGFDDEAEGAYQRSLAIYTNLDHNAGQSQALNNLGIIYFNLGDTNRALEHFKRSLALKEKLGDRSGEASTLNNIALLYEKTGSPSLALEHYERSYQLLHTMDDPRAEVVKENIETLRQQINE